MTTLLRALARPLIASAFIAEGIDVLRHPDDHLEAAQPIVEKASHLTGTHIEPSTAVKSTAWFMIGAGAALGTGILPRLAGAGLGLLALPLAVVHYPFWKAKPRDERIIVRRDFIRSAGLGGAALLAAADNGGKPSHSWRRAEAKRLAAVARASTATPATSASARRCCHGRRAEKATTA